jgi:hypothetical protein
MEGRKRDVDFFLQSNDSPSQQLRAVCTAFLAVAAMPLGHPLRYVDGGGSCAATWFSHGKKSWCSSFSADWMIIDFPLHLSPASTSWLYGSAFKNQPRAHLARYTYSYDRIMSPSSATEYSAACVGGGFSKCSQYLASRGPDALCAADTPWATTPFTKYQQALWSWGRLQPPPRVRICLMLFTMWLVSASFCWCARLIGHAVSIWCELARGFRLSIALTRTA